jgi:hypothetical protein
MYHLKQLKFEESYRVTLEFSNHEWRSIDLEPHLWGKVFEPLRDEEKFRQAVLDYEAETIVWPNGADFSPDFLYRHSKPVAP